MLPSKLPASVEKLFYLLFFLSESQIPVDVGHMWQIICGNAFVSSDR